ncbi:MAG: U32 family peptidase [Nanoarchaeota archaeon]
MDMMYDLATNFDDELIKRVADFGIVRNVYGKLREDVIGGGRPNFALPDVSRKQLEKHINLAHDNSISFNYLLNAICTDNREIIASTNRQIHEFVSYLDKIGVESFTVGSPFMLRLVKEQAPRIKVSVSVYNDADSLQRMKEWAQLGADELTLHYSYNRNFRKLEQVLRTIDIDLRLIANNVCLHECIYRTNHATALAHASQTKHESKGFFLDYYSLKCGRDKLANPVKLITADWIRPEDVHLYEELSEKVGKNNLSLKLTERTRTTDWLVNVVQAYAQKRKDGNLFDIINFIGNRAYAQIRKGSFIVGALKGKANPGKMLDFQKAVFLTPVNVNNRSLDGFIEYFKTHDCGSCVCDDLGWPDSETNISGACNYCRSWAKKAIIFQQGEEARKEALERCDKSLSDFEKGGMFRKR